MSTKIFDVYITDKPIFDVFKVFGDLHVKYKRKDAVGTIDQTFGRAADPLEITVAIIPLSKRRTIVKPFYSDLENTECAKELAEILNTQFKDYHYQNQTDKPDDISPQEWNARKMNWDRISDTYGSSYNDMGMIYTIWRPSEVTVRRSNRQW